MFPKDMRSGENESGVRWHDGSSSGSRTVAQTQEEVIQDDMEKTAGTESIAAGKVKDQIRCDIVVDAANKTQEAIRRQQQEAERALGVTKGSMQSARSTGRIIAAVKLLFLMVIVGCELDLYGFCMTFPEYWAQDILIVRVLCIITPVGYFLAAGMYLFYLSGENEKIEEQERKEAAAATKKNSMLETSGSAPIPAAPILKRESVRLRYYHFLPVFRYYVVIKEQEADDIEAIFRINSLSSFSLGLAQIVGLLFQGAVTGMPYTIFHKINMCSQCINWMITLLYFATPVSQWMKSVIKVDAMKYNDSSDMKKLMEQHAHLVKLAADLSNPSANQDLEKLVYRMDRWIASMADVNMNIDVDEFHKFEANWKFEVIGKLLQKKAAVYARS